MIRIAILSIGIHRKDLHRDSIREKFIMDFKMCTAMDFVSAQYIVGD